MFKIKEILINLRSSFWFVPSIFVALSIAMAFLLIEIDIKYTKGFAQNWPRLLGAGAQASRGMLSTIASSSMSMMTVAFSMTLVTLALASSQYTSRILRNFMRSKLTQVVLGIFAGIFTYCLIVLRTIRSGEEYDFVPSLSIVVGFILAIIGVVALVIFIHHIASSIQASSILALIHDETIKTIDKLFPENIREAPGELDRSRVPNNLKQTILANKSGYLQSLGNEELFQKAKTLNTAIRMKCGIGDFIISGTSLVSISDQIELTDKLINEIRDLFKINPSRTIEQDILFGIRQIVDIALKALSPGVNDTTTAVICVDYLTAILTQITLKKIPSNFQFEGSELRIIVHAPNYQTFLEASFNQIRTNAKGNVAVINKLIQSIQVLSQITSDQKRLHSLALEAQKTLEVAQVTIEFSYDKEDYKKEIETMKEIFHYL